MRKAVRALLDFVLPPRCLICSLSTSGASLPWVCQRCWGRWNISLHQPVLSVGSHWRLLQKALRPPHIGVEDVS